MQTFFRLLSPCLFRIHPRRGCHPCGSLYFCSHHVFPLSGRRDVPIPTQGSIFRPGTLFSSRIIPRFFFFRTQQSLFLSSRCLSCFPLMIVGAVQPMEGCFQVGPLRSARGFPHMWKALSVFIVSFLSLLCDHRGFPTHGCFFSPGTPFASRIPIPCAGVPTRVEASFCSHHVFPRCDDGAVPTPTQGRRFLTMALRSRLAFIRGVSIHVEASFSPHRLFPLSSPPSGFSNPREAFSYFPFSSTLSSSVPPRLLVLLLPRVFSPRPFPFSHFLYASC